MVFLGAELWFGILLSLCDWGLLKLSGPIPFLINSDVEAPPHDRPAFSNGFIYAWYYYVEGHPLEQTLCRPVALG